MNKNTAEEAEKNLFELAAQFINTHVADRQEVLANQPSSVQVDVSSDLPYMTEPTHTVYPHRGGCTMSDVHGDVGYIRLQICVLFEQT